MPEQFSDQMKQWILEDLWYRLRRHNFNCTKNQVELGLNILALKTGTSKENTALYIYWLLREGHKDFIPEIFIKQVTGWNSQAEV